MKQPVMKSDVLKIRERTDHITTKDATVWLFRVAQIKGIDIKPTQRFRLLHRIYGLILVTISSLFMPISFTYSYFNNSETEVNISAFLTSFQVAVNVYGGSLKFFTVICMWKRLCSCESVMIKLDARCKLQEEFLELRRLKVLGYRICLFFFGTYVLYSTCTFVSNLFIGRPPYSIYLPYINWQHTRWEFFLASFMEYGGMLLLCFQQTINDGYPVVYLAILRTHVKILLLRLARLGKDKEMSAAEHLEQLKLCIKDHKLILEFGKILDPIISITIFIQFTITAVMLAITLMHLTIFTTDMSTRIANISYILAVLAQFFPVCFFAQSLLDTQSHLPDQIFHTDWVDKNMIYRKMLVYYIQRTQQPVLFRAGKLFPIALSSFVSIAKFSFSVYTLITKMNLEETLGARAA